MAETTLNKKNTGPKRRRRKEARPAELIEAGLLEFAEKGYAATRLEDVAARAGVVKGTIYLYFENKDALFRAAVQSKITPTIEGVQQIIETFPGDTEDLVRMVLKVMYEKMVGGDVRVIMRILLSEGPRFPELLEYYHSHTISVGKKALCEILKRGVARGEFRKDIPLDQPLVLAGPAIAAAFWTMTFDPFDPLDVDAYARAHADIILKGLLARP